MEVQRRRFAVRQRVVEVTAAEDAIVYLVSAGSNIGDNTQ
jgi:hypothetical protein